MMRSHAHSKLPPKLRDDFRSRRLFRNTVCVLLLAVFLLHSCDNPSGPKKSSPTTTVSGKITTPAGNPLTTAQVWASTDPARKVKVKQDGSCSLGVFHSGSFTITAEDTDGNYKTSDPKPFNDIKAKNIDGQDIGLNYGHTTTLSGKTWLYSGAPPAAGGPRSGITVTIEVEGVEVGRTTSTLGSSRTTLGSYTFSDVAHNGTLTVKANRLGSTYSHTLRTTEPSVSHNIRLVLR